MAGFGNLTGGLAGMQQIGQWNPTAEVVIPLKQDHWRRLSRETQIRILDELGLLARTPEQLTPADAQEAEVNKYDRDWLAGKVQGKSL